MSDANPNISEGTCYFDNSGNEAPSRFIPCGNSNNGHVPCCESQDKCLSSRACYNGQFGVTYLAGCTDKNYEDEACPFKGDYADQTWVGLVYCNGTSNQWTGCHESDDAETVTVPERCWCRETSPAVLFEDASVLENSMVLPTATGEIVSWFGGVGPVTLSDSSTSSSKSTASKASAFTSSSNGDIATSQATITSPANVTSAIAFPTPTSLSEQADLSTGAKVGIGVGAGIGGFALLIMLVLLIRRCLAKKDQEPEQEEEKAETSMGYAHVKHESQAENGEFRSPSWSGYKSELPADEPGLTSSPTYADLRSNKSEIEGSPATGGAGRLISNGGYEMPGKKGAVFEMPG